VSIFTETYARLSDGVYDLERAGNDAPGTPFEVFRIIDKFSGYHGVIYRHKITDELVVAHRGTEFDGDPIRDLIAADGQMALLMLNQQLDGAREAVELALALAKRVDGTSVPVTVTGHSLGGALAQMTAAEYGLRGETFNAYGAAGLHRTPAGGDQVVNHVRATDMVSAAGRHFGSVRVYATEQDVTLLLQDGSPPDRQSGKQFLQDVVELGPGRTHAIEQFHGGRRDAKQIALYGHDSIIDPQNISRYEHDKPQFDAYRNDIREAALTIRHGMAINAMAAPQLAVVHQYFGLHYLSSKVAGVFDRDYELQELQAKERHPERPAAHRSVPQMSGPPLKPVEGDGEWRYERMLEDLDAARKPLAAGAGIHDLFERLGIAALDQDRDAARAVGRTYVQSEAGQTWLQQGVDHNQQVKAQAQSALEAQQTQAQQMEAPQHRAPVMRH